MQHSHVVGDSIWEGEAPAEPREPAKSNNNCGSTGVPPSRKQVLSYSREVLSGRVPRG